MKRWLFIFALVCPLVAQTFLNNSNRPIGSAFTETWGNSENPAGLCWASGPSTCGHLWIVGSGTANAVAACPAGLYTGTATNCLKMTEASGTAGNIYSGGDFTFIPAATAVD